MNRDLLNSIAQKMGMKHISDMASVCKTSNRHLNLTRSNMRNVFCNFRDDTMTREYTDKLTYKDREIYNDLQMYSFTDFIKSKYFLPTSLEDEDVEDVEESRGKSCIPSYASHPHILPLHVAIQTKRPTAMISNLIFGSVPFLSVRDVYGNFPLHLAILHHASNAVIMDLLVRCPEAAKHSNVDGDFPLHLAIRHNSIRRDASDDVVQRILRTFPDAAKHCNVDGDFPLHLSIRHNSSCAVIECILRSFPGATRMDEDVLPLHLAILHNSSDRVIKCILHSFPDAVKYSIDGSVFPLQLAIQHNSSDEVIRCIREAELQGLS